MHPHLPHIHAAVEIVTKKNFIRGVGMHFIRRAKEEKV